jgi:copper chaperone CopZ
MKRLIAIFALLLSVATLYAKDIQTIVVTTNPTMKCESCEMKIKRQLRFEKGIKNIVTDVPHQTVTITFDADKTTPENLMKSFEKIGYTVKEVDPAETTETKGCCGGGSCSDKEKK